MRHLTTALLLLTTWACTESEDAVTLSDEPIRIADDQLVVGNLTFDALVAGPEDGELVLLLHGYPTTSDAWRDYLIALGEAGYYAVAPDQRGYSPGARPPEVDDYAMVALEGDVLSFADALGRDTFHLVGHDWGAILAWTVAAWSPDRLLSLTAMSVPHPDPYTAEQRDPTSCQYEASSYFDALLTPGFENSMVANDAAGLRSLFGDLEEDSVDAYVDALGTPEALGAATDWYRANINGRVLGGWGGPLGTISVDTLFVYSDNDPALCEGPKNETAALVSGAYTERLLEGVDHWIPERAPDTVIPLLLEHLASASGP
ncbi:MAG: alpha/beta hydrolase [Myxococcota bacterium]